MAVVVLSGSGNLGLLYSHTTCRRLFGAVAIRYPNSSRPGVLGCRGDVRGDRYSLRDSEAVDQFCG